MRQASPFSDGLLGKANLTKKALTATRPARLFFSDNVRLLSIADGHNIVLCVRVLGRGALKKMESKQNRGGSFFPVHRPPLPDFFFFWCRVFVCSLWRVARERHGRFDCVVDRGKDQTGGW